MIGKKNEYGKLEILGAVIKSLGVARSGKQHANHTIDSTSNQEAENNSGYKIKRCCSRNWGQHIRSIQHTDYISRILKR
jgi:cell division protein FtsA